MKSASRVWIAFLVVMWAAPSPAFAKGEVWGMGGFFNLHQPLRGFGDWYSKSPQVGVALTYAGSSRAAVEIEYHRSTQDHGSLEKRTFVWSEDNRPYVSPNARSRIALNAVTVNGLLFARPRPVETHARGSTPYMAVGAGLYKYVSSVSGLYWPGQKKALTLLLDPFKDRRVSLGFFLGAGAEMFISGRVSLDLRARYHVALGNLRPMEAWGLKETFPLQMIDAGAGIKLYFKGE